MRVQKEPMSHTFHLQEWRNGSGDDLHRINTVSSSAIVLPTSLLLLRLEVLLDGAIGQTRYIHLFDATSIPPDGTAPVWRNVARGGEVTPIHFSGLADMEHRDGVHLEEGLVVALSSTQHLFTATSAVANFQAIIRYGEREGSS
jgi:hypothetical protein